MAPLALLLLLLAGTASLPRPAAACTSYIVGRAASGDGSVIIARNDDGEGAVDPSNLVYHPARDAPAVWRSNINALQVTLPAPGLAYFGVPNGPLADAAAGRNTSGEAAGINSAGVAISATESIYNSAAALAADPLNEESGTIEDAIPSIILPQATSARHGAQLLGQLVEERGAGEAFGVLFADATEAWYLESASGHHWMAQRVPDNMFFVSANQGRFQAVDLGDSNAAMASRGLRQFAVDAGLFDPTSGQPFNFFKSFMRDGVHDTNYSYPRVCMLQRRWGGVAALPCHEPHAPVFLPSRPVRIWPEDVMAAMRHHWDGTDHDPYLHANPDEPWRPIALLRTEMGHVTVLRAPSADLPDGLSAITYVAMSTPKLSPFIPIYKGLPGDALPPELATRTPQRTPDRVSLFWRARRVQALVFQNWRHLAPEVVDEIAAFERRVQLGRDRLEQDYREALAAGDEGGGAALLASWTAGVAAEAGHMLDNLAEWAAEELGMAGVPDDARMLQLLEAAAEAYAFEPTSDDSASMRRRRASGGSAHPSLFARRDSAMTQ